MPFSYEDFFSFYRTEFLPAYTIVYDWIDYETVDINAKVVEILTSVANSFNSGSDGDEKERHKHNADQDLRDLTVLCYYFYSISFKSYFIDPIVAHPTTAKYCISVGFDLFQTKVDEFNELLEKVQETTLKGEDPLRSDTIAVYREINDLSLIIKRYIRESELDRWKSRWKKEGTQEIQKTLIDAIVDEFSHANPKNFTQNHPYFYSLILLIIGYAINHYIGPQISNAISNSTVNTSLHP
jgi:hypothetical protein